VRVGLSSYGNFALDLMTTESPRQRARLPISLLNEKALERHTDVSAFLGTQAQRDGFVLMVAFLITFLFIRTSARMIRAEVSWWPGNVETGSGLHIHHLVWGICLLLLSGFMSIALNPGGPWGMVLAAGFGIGAGLTLDEFALWLRLEDVYWAQEGTASLDAVVVAALLGGLILLGLSPVDASHNATGPSIAFGLALNVVFCVLAVLKGRLFLGLIGLFLLPVSLVAALRLAAPWSPWARWFYRPGSRKLSRSEARFARVRGRRARIMDLIGGTPTAAAATATAVPVEQSTVGDAGQRS
jgi:hypothetical protein